MTPSTDSTPAEAKRFAQRRQAFIDAGQAPDDATALAESMAKRDRPDSFDDRRLCFECANFRRGRCDANQIAMPFILQRCDYFELLKKRVEA